MNPFKIVDSSEFLHSSKSKFHPNRGMWVLPTYDRPERVQKTLDSIEQAGCKTEGIVYLDGVKNPLYDRLRLPPGWSIWKNKENRGVCASLNEVFSRYPTCSWYGFLSDDSIVRTAEWDEKLLSYADDFAIVHSADGWQSDQRIHGAIVFGGELIRALGWWVPSGLIHSFCDDAWEAIAKKMNLRRYVKDVLVEHQHFWNGKTNFDSSYLKAYSTFEEDQIAFQKWKKEDFQKAVERIQIKMKENRLKRIFLQMSPSEINFS